MSQEGQLLDRKSLRAVTGKSADWDEVANYSIASANATGGRVLLDIEDGQDQPPPRQRIPTYLTDVLMRKLAARTVIVDIVNTLALPSIDSPQTWLKRRVERQQGQSAGRAQAIRYLADAKLLRTLNFIEETTLNRIEPHPWQPLRVKSRSAIPGLTSTTLEELTERGAVRFECKNRWRRYWAVS